MRAQHQAKGLSIDTGVRADPTGKLPVDVSKLDRVRPRPAAPHDECKFLKVGEMSNPIQQPVTFAAACALERDYVYLAGKPDGMDGDDASSRLLFFDGQNTSGPWAHHDLPDWTVVSLCVHANAFGAKRVDGAHSRNGDIEYRWSGGEHTEHMSEAGVARAALPVFGYVNAIREISGQLYVCGSGGQVYLRSAATGCTSRPR